MSISMGPKIKTEKYQRVTTYADLPEPSGHESEIYLVLVGTGTFGVDRKRAGLYHSDGTAWVRLGTLEAIESPPQGVLYSSPPDGFDRVTNLYLKEEDEEIILKT